MKKLLFAVMACAMVFGATLSYAQDANHNSIRVTVDSQGRRFVEAFNASGASISAGTAVSLYTLLHADSAEVYNAGIKADTLLVRVSTLFPDTFTVDSMAFDIEDSVAGLEWDLWLEFTGSWDATDSLVIEGVAYSYLDSGGIASVKDTIVNLTVDRHSHYHWYSVSMLYGLTIQGAAAIDSFVLHAEPIMRITTATTALADSNNSAPIGIAYETIADTSMGTVQLFGEVYSVLSYVGTYVARNDSFIVAGAPLTVNSSGKYERLNPETQAYTDSTQLHFPVSLQRMVESNRLIKIIK